MNSCCEWRFIAFEYQDSGEVRPLHACFANLRRVWPQGHFGTDLERSRFDPITKIGRKLFCAELDSEIIGSVLLYPKGTVIVIPRSAPITLSCPLLIMLVCINSISI